MRNMNSRSSSKVAWAVGLPSIALMICALVLMFMDRHARLPAGSSGAWTLSSVLSIAVNAAVPTIGILCRRHNITLHAKLELGDGRHPVA